MTSNAMPLFCGVHAKEGKFEELTAETAVYIPLTNDPAGPRIVSCPESAVITAKRVAKMYGWAFAEIPLDLAMIINPPVDESYAETEDDSDYAPTSDEDEEDDDDTEAPAPAPVAKAPKAKAVSHVSNPPVADDDDDDDWAELTGDLGTDEEELATVPAGPVTKGQVAPAVDPNTTPDLVSAHNKLARAWAQSNNIIQSDGKPVGKAGRLHASIKALYLATQLTPAQRKSAIVA